MFRRISQSSLSSTLACRVTRGSWSPCGSPTLCTSTAATASAFAGGRSFRALSSSATGSEPGSPASPLSPTATAAATKAAASVARAAAGTKKVTKRAATAAAAAAVSPAGSPAAAPLVEPPSAPEAKRRAPAKRRRRAEVTGSTDLSESEFFASLGLGDGAAALDPASPAAAPAEGSLVYNAFTGRLTSPSSPGVASLLAMGFGIGPERHLHVTDPAALNALAARIRAGTATLPPKWPASLARNLGAILTNPDITDPAAAAEEMIKIKVNSLIRSHYASVVSGGDVDGPQGPNPLSPDDDPTKSIELNEEQRRVIEVAMQGRHMYIGGSAGTGKTVLLRVLSRRLQANRLRVGMTATTGVAGCHIGGSTFHHAMGVSAGGEFLRRGNMLDYDVLIIDEVSMFPQRLFEDFDRVLREEAGTPDIPFGGVQIILCGDFLQLGCINESSVISSKLFRDNFVSVRLQTIVRQSAHPAFARDLQAMRLGTVPADLTRTVQQLPPGTMVESAVNLLPTNKEVHVANEQELARLEGDPLTLLPETGITSLQCDTTATLLLRVQAHFQPEVFSQHVCALLQATLDLPRPSLLSLYKVYDDGYAMRLMLPQGESIAWREAMRERFLEVAGLLNDLQLGASVTEILPNGNGLHTPESEDYLTKLMAKHPIAQPLTVKKGCRVLLRANLSSALVNGSIGTVVDFVECKTESFPPYLRSEGLDACVERYRVFCLTECGMPVPMVPVVRFHSGETVAVPPWEFSVGGGANTHFYSLSSVALPLSLAYAFTVHKVQGLTLVGRVHLELSRMWPCEHLLYVAMSRVRNPEQLSMSSFRPEMVVANPECVAFDASIKAAAEITDADTAAYPVSSWKRCNDTVYHLRRRGASLRRLLEGAQPNSSSNNSSNNNNNSAGVGMVGDHLAQVEQSVIVARRLKKLVKQVERVARLNETRKSVKKIEATVNGSSDGGDGSSSSNNNNNIVSEVGITLEKLMADDDSKGETY